MQHTNIMFFLHYEKATEHNQESLMISCIFLIILLDPFSLIKINGHNNNGCGDFTYKFIVLLLTLQTVAIVCFKNFFCIPEGDDHIAKN